MTTTQTVIKIEQYGTRLVNRDQYQGDGQHTAVDFRERFLTDLDSEDWWKDSSKTIEIDFTGVETLGPSWANEAFAYFTKFKGVNPEYFFKKIVFTNISRVKKETIKIEIEDGYKR